MYNKMLQSKKHSRYSGFNACFPGTDVKGTNYRLVEVEAATTAKDY